MRTAIEIPPEMYINFGSRSLPELANYMYILTEAFRKFSVTETACQILVACEAGVDHDGKTKGQGKKHPVYGRLPAKVHKILRSEKLLYAVWLRYFF